MKGKSHTQKSCATKRASTLAKKKTPGKIKVKGKSEKTPKTSPMKGKSEKTPKKSPMKGKNKKGTRDDEIERNIRLCYSIILMESYLR